MRITSVLGFTVFKRSAGVAPEVNLRIAQVTRHPNQVSTQALKSRTNFAKAPEPGATGPPERTSVLPIFFKIWSINKNKCCDVSHIGYLLLYSIGYNVTVLWWCCTCCVQCCGDVAHVVVMLHMLCTMQLYCCHVRTDAQTVYCSCLINHM